MQTVLGKKSSACMIGLVSKIFSGALFSKLFSVIIPVVIKKKKNNTAVPILATWWQQSAEVYFMFILIFI